MDHSINPLSQYGSHAFLSYLDSTSKSPASSSSSSPSSEQLDSATSSPPFTLHNTSSWTYSGSLLHPTSSSLPPSFHTWTAATISQPTAFLARLLPLLSFLETFLRNAGAQHYWLTIRASKANHDYDMTRWHTDDIFFDYEGEKDRVGFNQHDTTAEQEQKERKANSNSKKPNTRKNGYWKLATTLLGPSTLFLKDGAQARHIQRAAKQNECAKRGAHTCTSFRCLGCLDAVEAVRRTLDSEFCNHAVERPAFGEIAFFRLGDEEGAVHSEPACHEDRIFVNIVPGTEDELRGLMRRWGLGFPRAWCFGVPVGFDDVGVLLGASGGCHGKEKETEKEMEIQTQSKGQEQGHVVNGIRDDADEDGDKEEKKGNQRDGVHTTTMSMNLRDEYTEWLRKKGFRASKIFGSIAMS